MCPLSLGMSTLPVTGCVRSSRPASYPVACVLVSPGSSHAPGAIAEEQLLSCGASDCLMAVAPTNGTQRPSQELIYTLLGIYTGACSAAVTGAPRGANRASGAKEPVCPRAREAPAQCARPSPRVLA